MQQLSWGWRCRLLGRELGVVAATVGWPRRVAVVTPAAMEVARSSDGVRGDGSYAVASVAIVTGCDGIGALP